MVFQTEPITHRFSNRTAVILATISTLMAATVIWIRTPLLHHVLGCLLGVAAILTLALGLTLLERRPIQRRYPRPSSFTPSTFIAQYLELLMVMLIITALVELALPSLFR